MQLHIHCKDGLRVIGFRETAESHALSVIDMATCIWLSSARIKYRIVESLRSVREASTRTKEAGGDCKRARRLLS